MDLPRISEDVDGGPVRRACRVNLNLFAGCANAGIFRWTRRGLPIRDTSVAHLKFLHRKLQIPPRNFKWKSDTRVIDLLVPITFRSS